MLAPLEDAIHIVHGPVGCAYYGGTVRGRPFRVFSTALEEKDIVFGGGKQLIRTLKEARAIMPHARYCFVYATCSAAIIGDDIDGICKEMEKEFGFPVIFVNCPGFKGDSQASGHRVAYESLLDGLIGQGERAEVGAHDVNIIGDYKIGESMALKSLLEEMGIRVRCIFTGHADYEGITAAHRVKLNLLICRSSGRFLAEALQERYEIPYLEVTFMGLSQTMAGLRRIGQYFGLETQAEKVIATGYKAVKPGLDRLLPGLKGKKAALFFGAARMASLVKALDDMGMEVIFTGSQFGDSATYKETWQNVNPGAYIIDDASEHDLEHLLDELRPDVFMGGIKEQFLSHKFGIGFCLLQQLKCTGVGFQGFLNLAASIHNAVHAPVWKLASPNL
jgi:nitrogenase molybdenum-cofactor synthesis protein NifE